MTDEERNVKRIIAAMKIFGSMSVAFGVGYLCRGVPGAFIALGIALISVAFIAEGGAVLRATKP